MGPGLTTEAPYGPSDRIDSLSTEEAMRVINAADQEVAPAVERVIPQIAEAVDRVATLLDHGGRLFYMGAGTSGRLGVLDASECPPTFSVPPTLVQGIIAGGDRALRLSAEKAEDDPQQGAADLRERDFSSLDALVGIAASGRTPYVLGALRYARELGALTIGLSCTENSQIAAACDIPITPVPGPEVITGSTRMRAGTATKLVLNMLSTGIMIRRGFVYGNLMVNVQPTNEKLIDRACRIIVKVSGVPYDQAARLLADGGSVRAAIVMAKTGLAGPAAQARLEAVGGRLRQALGE